MTAIREQIFAKIEELLGTISGIGEVERMPSGDPSAFPALYIFDEGHTLAEEEAGTTRYALSVSIDGYVKGGDGAESHAALNTLYSAVIAKLVTEPPIDGLAEEITEVDMKPTVAARASERRLAFALDLTIYFATERGNPDAG